MDQTIPIEKDIEFDLESGGNTSEEDAENDLYINERESKGTFSWGWNGIKNSEGSEKGKSGVESCSNATKPAGDAKVMDKNSLRLLVEKCMVQEPSFDVNENDEKQKTKILKSSKPPLPPRGPSLNAGDQKFVKELAKLAALRKRARVKKMKAVKTMKISKSSSSMSYANLSAMVITIIFFLVIILHGIRSANSAAIGLITSPETTSATNEGLISFAKKMMQKI